MSKSKGGGLLLAVVALVAVAGMAQHHSGQVEAPVTPATTTKTPAKAPATPAKFRAPATTPRLLTAPCPSDWVCGTCPNGDEWGYLNDGSADADWARTNTIFDVQHPCK